jgi:hypothetical protein
VNNLAIYQSANSFRPWVTDHMTSNYMNIVKIFQILNLRIVKDQQSFTYFICWVLSRFFLHFVQTKYIPRINADFLYIWWEVAQHSSVAITVKLRHKFSYVPRENFSVVQWQSYHSDWNETPTVKLYKPCHVTIYLSLLILHRHFTHFTLLYFLCDYTKIQGR